MKFLTAVLVIISIQTFAAEKHEVVTSKATVRIGYGLRCITNAGQVGKHHTYTELQSPIGGLIAFGLNDIELTHVWATQEGCAMDKLDQIAFAAVESYGFQLGTPVKLTKDLTASHKNGAGQCTADYKETLTMTLAPGVVLTSVQDEFRAMNDCE